jgi:diacylglycerol kinase
MGGIASDRVIKEQKFMAHRFRTPGYHPLRKFKIIWAGLQVAVVSDFSVAYKVVLSVLVLLISLKFRQWMDVTQMLLAAGLMVMAEIFNSAIENLCDFVKDDYDEQIRIIKDMAAAGAGISILVWAGVLIMEISHIVSWFQRQ